jgi:hypothetical protein
VSARTQYLAWRGQPHVGCVFARLIARKPKRYGQKIEEVANKSAPAKVAKRIAEIVKDAIADPKVSAVTLLFPGLDNFEKLVSIMLALQNESGWSVKTTKLKKPPVTPFVALHAVCDIPFGTGLRPSEALVLGPFSEFPPTRRAPVPALEIFVGDPRPMGPLNDTAITKANLAHMEMYLPTHNTFMIMWNSSHTGRSRALKEKPESKETDQRAKAKVTLVMKPALAKKLGCHP